MRALQAWEIKIDNRRREAARGAYEYTEYTFANLDELLVAYDALAHYAESQNAQVDWFNPDGFERELRRQYGFYVPGTSRAY